MKKLMEYKGYHAKVELDVEDNIFVGTVICINDSLSFHGSSIDELIEMFHQSIDNYLEMCESFGKVPDKEFSGTFNVRVPSDLHRLAYLRSQQEDVSLNKVIEEAMRKYLYSRENESYFPMGQFTKMLTTLTEYVSTAQYSKTNTAPQKGALTLLSSPTTHKTIKAM